jgi:hypothetical protein
MALVNQYNFLRFSDDSISDEELPQAYIRDRCQFEAMPIIVPAENIAFYVNTQYGVDYGASPYLRIIKDSGETVWEDSVLSKDTISIDRYNPYADFTIPALDNGVYRFQIIDGTTVKCTSNPVLCMNEDYENISSYVEFTNNQNYYNVRYAELSNFYQKFRLRITDISGGEYEANTEMYRSETTGRYRDLLSNLQKYYIFECYYYDKYAFEAIAIFLAHRTRLINGKEYAFKEGLTKNAILTTKVTKGTFQMYDQEFSTINTCNGELLSS